MRPCFLSLRTFEFTGRGDCCCAREYCPANSKRSRRTEAELGQWFAHPSVRSHAGQELQRIALYSEQIAELEKTILE